MMAGDQMPLKLGLRFSMKAATPSFAPFFPNTPAKIDASYSSPCSRVVSSDAFTALLPAISAQPDLLAIAFTMSATACSKLSVGSRWATLSLWASLASIGRPVRIMRFATFSPTILGSNCVPPMPGMMPRVISGSPNVAFSEQRMTSLRRASSKPPPNALPSTTATMGLWCSRKTLSAMRKLAEWGQAVRSRVTKPLMLAPAQKILGRRLRRTMTLMAGSRLSSVTALVSSWNISWERALRSLGLLSHTVATSSPSLRAISSLVQANPIASCTSASLFIQSYYTHPDCNSISHRTPLADQARQSRMGNWEMINDWKINFQLLYLGCHQFLLGMSKEECNSLEQADDLPLPNLKCRSKLTAVSFCAKNPSFLDQESPLDCSFEQAIHQQNLAILKNATVRYLEQTIGDRFDKEEGFKDRSLYCCAPEEVSKGSELEEMTRRNALLAQSEKQELGRLLEEHGELLGLAKQLHSVFGSQVGKQLVCIIYHVLTAKIAAFRQLRTPSDPFLPRLDCFYEDEDNTAFSFASPVYDDFNADQIPQFVEEGMDELCRQLYTSNRLKYLTLREINHPPKASVCPAKFTAVVKQVARTLFYSLSGAVEPAECGASALFALDLSKEVSLLEFSEGSLLGIQRSFSRPFASCEDDQADCPTKRQKTD